MSLCCHESQQAQKCFSCRREICENCGREVFQGDMFLWKCKDCIEESETQQIRDLHALLDQAKENKLEYMGNNDIVLGWTCKSCDLVISAGQTATECWRCATPICCSCVIKIVGSGNVLRCRAGECAEHDGEINIDDEWLA